MPKVTKQCEWCGGEFQAVSWEVNRGKAKFCSVECKGKFGRSLQDQSGANNPAWKGGVWKDNTLTKAREWNAANPEKKRAHHAVQQEIKMGRLTRQPCENCGSTEHIDAHHADYTKPLDVTWLCRRCHLSEHRSAA